MGKNKNTGKKNNCLLKCQQGCFWFRSEKKKKKTEKPEHWQSLTMGLHWGGRSTLLWWKRALSTVAGRRGYQALRLPVLVREETVWGFSYCPPTPCLYNFKSHPVKELLCGDIFIPLAAQGLTVIAAAALTLPSPWGLSFRSPGVFGLPVRISYDCQTTSN